MDWGIYYKTDWVRSDHDKIEDALTKIRIKQESELEATLATLDDSILVHTWAQDSAIVSRGEQLYNTICFTCHGAQLDAPHKLGLSLIDGIWKYGAAPLDIFKIINEGTPADSKGMDPTGARMIPWGQQYTPKQIAEVTAFLISKNPEDFGEY